MITDYKAPITLRLWLPLPIPGNHGCHRGRHRQHLCHTAHRQPQREVHKPASPFHLSSASFAVQEGHRDLVGNWCHSQQNLLHLAERQENGFRWQIYQLSAGMAPSEGFSQDKGIIDTGTVSPANNRAEETWQLSVCRPSRAKSLLKGGSALFGKFEVFLRRWSHLRNSTIQYILLRKNTWHVNLAFIFQMCSS